MGGEPDFNEEFKKKIKFDKKFEYICQINLNDLHSCCPFSSKNLENFPKTGVKKFFFFF